MLRCFCIYFYLIICVHIYIPSPSQLTMPISNDLYLIVYTHIHPKPVATYYFYI